MEMFITYQIPSDLMSYDDDANAHVNTHTHTRTHSTVVCFAFCVLRTLGSIRLDERTSIDSMFAVSRRQVSSKIEAVKRNVAQIQEMIAEMKKKELQEEAEKATYRVMESVATTAIPSLSCCLSACVCVCFVVFGV